MKRLVSAALGLAIVACGTAANGPSLSGSPGTPAPVPTPLVIYVTPAPARTDAPKASPKPSIATTAVPSPAPSRLTHLFRGKFKLQAYPVSATGDSCAGTGGYADIHAGLQVAIKNQAGTILGVGSLRDFDHTFDSCTFIWEVANIPDDAKFYTVTIGQRGDLSYSHDEIAAKYWFVETSLGD